MILYHAAHAIYNAIMVIEFFNNFIDNFKKVSYMKSTKQRYFLEFGLF